MGKILVTGALGNVGSYVAKYTLENGQEIVVGSRSIEALEKKFKDTAKCVKFDFTKEETFEEALADVDRVFIVRPPHLGKPEDLKPFINALEKRKENIKLVSFLSLIGVENNPVPPTIRLKNILNRQNCHIVTLDQAFLCKISAIYRLLKSSILIEL